MNVKEQIKEYIISQSEPKRSEIQELPQHLLQVLSKSKLWFFINCIGSNQKNNLAKACNTKTIAITALKPARTERAGAVQIIS